MCTTVDQLQILELWAFVGKLYNTRPYWNSTFPVYYTMNWSKIEHDYICTRNAACVIQHGWCRLAGTRKYF